MTPPAAIAVAPATILVVEDEPATLDLVTAALRREGYIVIDAPGPAAAIGLAAMHPGELDLVLTDVVMPEMNGVQMFEQIARHRPRARVVFMSGFGGDGVHGYADAPLLHKPFGVNGLIAAARAALAER